VNDTATLPTTTGVIARAREILQRELSQHPAAGDADDVTKRLCALCRMPYAGDMPTPGIASGWERKEWGLWAEANGYDYKGDTAHNFLWENRAWPQLSIGLAKTTGDRRSSMALASQVRRATRKLNTVAHCALLALHNGTPDMAKLEADVAAIVAAQGIDPASDGEVLSTVLEALTRVPQTTARVAAGDLPGAPFVECRAFTNVLSKLEREFGYTQRRALKAAGVEDAPAERLMAVLRGAGPTVHLRFAHEYGDLVDLLALLREQDRLQRDEKAAAREAERAAREAKRAAAAKGPSKRDQLLAVLHQRHNVTEDQLLRVKEAFASAQDRLNFALSNLPAVSLPDDLNDPELVERCASLEAQLAAFQATEAAQGERIRTLEAQLADAEQYASKQEVAKADREHLIAFAGLVRDAVKGASNMNPFALVEALNSLAAEADTILKAHA
jgi:hypothetical protein